MLGVERESLMPLLRQQRRCRSLLAMYCLSQAKNGLSALALGRQLGVNNNTARLLKHKLVQAMLERDHGYCLEGSVQVDDAYLGGELPAGKRGRGSEKKTPLPAAVRVTADGQPACIKPSVLEGFGKAEAERWARQHLRPGCTVQSDGLFRGGHGGRPPAPALRDRRQSRLRDVFAAVGEHDCGQRQARLGRHLPCFPAQVRGALPAEFQYRFNRRYALAELPRRLLRAAALAQPLPRPLAQSAAA